MSFTQCARVFRRNKNAVNSKKQEEKYCIISKVKRRGIVIIKMLLTGKKKV